MVLLYSRGMYVVRMGVVGDTECNSIHAVITHCAYLETFNLSTVLCSYTCIVACKHTIYENSSASTPHPFLAPKHARTGSYCCFQMCNESYWPRIILS